MALSNNIRKLRFENGEMTQKRLAERVGISRQTMNAIENGKQAPRIDVAIRIADVFGVTVDDLFGCTYGGKPKRRSEAPTNAIVPGRVRVDEVIDDPAEDDSVEDEVESVISAASLRDII